MRARLSRSCFSAANSASRSCSNCTKSCGSGIPNAETTLTVTDNLKVSPSDFDQFCVAVPNDNRLPASGQQLCGLYDVRPALFGQADNVIKSAEDGRRKTRVYNGVDLTTNLRFGQGGQLSGGVSIGRMVTDNCVVVDTPQDARPGFCRTARPWGAATDVKLLVVYPLPYDIQVGASYTTSRGRTAIGPAPRSSASMPVAALRMRAFGGKRRRT